MAYTAEKPRISEPTEELRARIRGRGAHLDPPTTGRCQRSGSIRRVGPGAHWAFPECQPEKWPRERSIEHKFLTPVFGTACPPKGISGAMRK
jgi:hypothetical protein